MNEENAQMLREFASVINRHSLEKDSNTPDFILAIVALDAINSFNKSSIRRENWYGKTLGVGKIKIEGEQK